MPIDPEADRILRDMKELIAESKRLHDRHEQILRQYVNLRRQMENLRNRAQPQKGGQMKSERTF
jgi:hypothetical protein